MGRTISPCKDCDEREAGCHAQCNKYALWKQEMQDRKALIYSKKTLEHEFSNIRQDAIRKYKHAKSIK